MNLSIRVTGTLAGTALVAGTLAASGPSAAADDVNVAPVRTIQGPTHTQLRQPLGMYVRGGQIHVSNFGASSILVFDLNADGDVPPKRRIAGATSLVSSPRTVAADSAGFTWVTSASSAPAGNRVLSFRATATGNVAPASRFDPGFVPFGVAIDKNDKVNVSNEADTIKVFSRSATGTPAAERTIKSTHLSNARGLAVDAANRLWVANGDGDSVVAFAPGATGNAAPARVIKGSQTQIQFATDVALDASGRVYVADHRARDVKVFAAHANGNVAPIKVLGGAAAALTSPAGVAVAPDGTVVVADYDGHDVSSFAPLFAPPKPAVKVPSKPRALKVSGTARAKTRKVSWRPPSNKGGAKITGYRLVVKKGNKVLLRKNVGASKRSYKIKRAKLRKGKLTVYVKAKNSKGYGKNAKATFRVRK
ncbi:fibronectin type III domain-containing protein [Mumia quercus]|uniref:fibronectin type III domain-containing protein n=1 Tax=Mumia quercus TaxID=2976125 RepID=UPI0021D14D6D|nr:fibronectin type III domain-containing protein [Mumia quercus]